MPSSTAHPQVPVALRQASPSRRASWLQGQVAQQSLEQATQWALRDPARKGPGRLLALRPPFLMGVGRPRGGEECP